MLQAQEFIKAISPHPSVAGSSATFWDQAGKPTKPDPSDTSAEAERNRFIASCREEAALEVIDRHPMIAHEASEKYARALIEREMAVLMLGEAKLVADIDQGGREVRACSPVLIRPIDQVS